VTRQPRCGYSYYKVSLMNEYKAYMNDNDREKPMFSEKKIVHASLRTPQIPK